MKLKTKALVLSMSAIPILSYSAGDFKAVIFVTEYSTSNNSVIPIVPGSDSVVLPTPPPVIPTTPSYIPDTDTTPASNPACAEWLTFANDYQNETGDPLFYSGTSALNYPTECEANVTMAINRIYSDFLIPAPNLGYPSTIEEIYFNDSIIPSSAYSTLVSALSTLQGTINKVIPSGGQPQIVNAFSSGLNIDYIDFYEPRNGSGELYLPTITVSANVSEMNLYAGRRSTDYLSPVMEAKMSDVYERNDLECNPSEHRDCSFPVGGTSRLQAACKEWLQAAKDYYDDTGVFGASYRQVMLDSATGQKVSEMDYCPASIDISSMNSTSGYRELENGITQPYPGKFGIIQLSEDENAPFGSRTFFNFLSNKTVDTLHHMPHPASEKWLNALPSDLNVNRLVLRATDDHNSVSSFVFNYNSVDIYTAVDPGTSLSPYFQTFPFLGVGVNPNVTPVYSGTPLPPYYKNPKYSYIDRPDAPWASGGGGGGPG